MSWLPKKAVVVPVDFSEDSLAAVEVARTLVESPAHLHIIHVLPPLVPTEPGVIWDAVDDTSRREHAEDALRQRIAKTSAAGANLTVDFGDAGREIAEFAQSVKAELIVIPSHGRTGIERFFLGSTAERVVRLSHCPVLVLRK